MVGIVEFPNGKYGIYRKKFFFLKVFYNFASDTKSWTYTVSDKCQHNLITVISEIAAMTGDSWYEVVDMCLDEKLKQKFYGEQQYIL